MTGHLVPVEEGNVQEHEEYLSHQEAFHCLFLEYSDGAYCNQAGQSASQRCERPSAPTPNQRQDRKGHGSACTYQSVPVSLHRFMRNRRKQPNSLVSHCCWPQYRQHGII
ncbi:Uncharacterized protein HZ326_22553 [Fusarium oxysporum f. sp. albedinis]|nr:Uncharacterized protein HZ326_22553 [Fusarium oxysporum f. sp. albedinis]